LAQLRLTQSPTLRKGTTVKAEDDGDNDIEVENDDLPSVLRPATMRPLSFIRYPNLKFQEWVGFLRSRGFPGFPSLATYSMSHLGFNHQFLC
jgi:hypothetical protein